MTRFKITTIAALLTGGLFVTATLGAQSPADTASKRCIDQKAEALKTANGNGLRRNLADTLKVCNASWFSRAKSRVDTVKVTDTLYLPPPPTNRPPVASFTVVSNDSTRTVRVTSTSTDDKGVVVTAWSWGDGTAGAATPSAQHTYADWGTFTISLVVEDAERLTGTATQKVVLSKPVERPPDDTLIITDDTTHPPSIATRAALPKLEPKPTFGKALRTVAVTPLMDLQAALNAAQPGDSLVLSGTFTGNFVLPTRQCGAGITVTSLGTLPTGRITPTKAAGLAKLVTPNSAPALKTVNPTCGWRIVGIEITGTLAQTSQQYGLLWLGDGGWAAGGDTQTDSSKVPQQIVLDRVYLHGGATNTQRCLALNSGATVVRDSWISECHAIGADAQAIGGWNGPGPYLIENNYLEGSGENVMFGGADPGIAGLVPSDITIRRNHIAKPLTWKGGPWSIKNLLELKSAQRVLIEGNVIENVWPAGQEGPAVVFKSNANGCQCAFEGTRDVTMRYNIVRNDAFGLHIIGQDNSYGWTGFVHVQRVTIEHNLFSGTGQQGGRCLHMLVSHDPKHVIISHNTFVHDASCNGIALSMAYAMGASALDLSDNVMTVPAGYALFYDGGIVHEAALRAFAGTAYSFQRNAVGGMLTDYVGQNPSTSWYVPTVAGLGLAADYSLLPTSQFKGKGYNGADPGADIAEITRRTAGVVVAP